MQILYILKILKKKGENLPARINSLVPLWFG